MLPVRPSPLRALAIASMATLVSVAVGLAAATPRSDQAGRAVTSPSGAAAEAVALGAAPAAHTSYANGESAVLAPGLRDVAHEHGCRWVDDTNETVEAWVFAPHVDRARAADLVADARQEARCAPTRRMATPGDPGVAVLCRTGGRTTVTAAGLLGDAWFTCRVASGVPSSSGSALQELLLRADEWCGVALGAAAS